MTLTPEEAERFARAFEGYDKSVKAQLEKMRDEVRGDPDGLVRVADGYVGLADRMQRTFEQFGAHRRVLRENWRGWAHDDFQATAEPIVRSISTVVLNLRAERGWLVQVAEALRTAHSRIVTVQQTFAPEAQRIINSVRTGQVDIEAVNKSWQKLVTDSVMSALRAQREFGDLLGKAWPHGQPGWWRRNAGEWFERQLAGQIERTTPQPSRTPAAQGLDAQGTEFSESIQGLVGRMTLDATSPIAAELRLTPYELRFGDWAKLVGPGGQWDLKAYFDRMWGMSDRNNFHIPLPADIGTIGGRPVEIDRDLLGNIHYGYTAAAIGYWSGTAQVGANVADILFHGGMDKGDQIGMAIGVELHRSLPSGTELTPQFVGGLNQAVVGALRTNFDELVRTGKIRVR
jgi:uncharacterized protein YukE